MPERKVTFIPQTINPKTRIPENIFFKRRVAAYSRVSTDSDEQYTSFEAQVDYYTKYITRNPDWAFVKVYTDEGISGTETRRRDGFNEMISDALAGKIDLIVTKSVSRFARNTVDSLVTIRELKAHNIEVYFEKENIWTFDGKGELLLTIMSSLAQEESRSISENVTWGQRKRFSDGKVSLPYKGFLGYDKGEGKDARPVINQEQAVIVRRIYSDFMKGKTPGIIAKELTTEGIPTARGKQVWSSKVVTSILTNEKYMGAALLQKRYTVDFLTHTTKKNEGEVPQYYVEHSHEAIIAPEEWEAVQDEFRRRKEFGNAYSGVGSLASKLVCADCGGFYGSKVWHSNDKFRRIVWQCNMKYVGDKKCATPALDEKDVKEKFIEAFNEVFASKEQVIEEIELICSVIADTSAIDAEINSLLAETEVIGKLIDGMIAENSSSAQNQDEFRQKYETLVEKYEKARNRCNILSEQKRGKLSRAREINRFAVLLRKRDAVITEFDQLIWQTAVEKVTVRRSGTLEFHFYGGQTVKKRIKK